MLAFKLRWPFYRGNFGWFIGHKTIDSRSRDPEFESFYHQSAFASSMELASKILGQKTFKKLKTSKMDLFGHLKLKILMSLSHQVNLFCINF